MAVGRKTGGRVAGVPNKRSAAKRAALKVVVTKFEAETPGAFAGDSVEFLQMLYRDPNQSMSVRLAAATTASKFERPTLTAVAVRDVTPQSTTPGGIDSAIEALLLKGSANVVTVESRSDSDGAGWVESDGSAGVAEVTPAPAAD
jgi:hypothetical protein